MLGLLTAAIVLVLAAGCGPREPAPASGLPQPEAARTEGAWFTDVTGDARLDFVHAAGRGDYHIPEITGAGGALFDHDGDGDLDVYLVNGASAEGGAPNRMFRQEAGGTFTDVTEASGLGDPGYGMGAALGDVDNDGDLDLYVTNLGPDALYLNGGGGVYRAAAASGFDDEAWSSAACFLDYDGDGLLDLYVATYVDFDPPKACTDQAGQPDFCGPGAFLGVPDRLYRNLGRVDGEVAFLDVSSSALAGRGPTKGLGVICADLDGDARPDVYVANDGEENQLWINRGDGTFEDQAPLLGVALNMFSKPEASMGLAVGDVDGDLDLDLFVTHLARETNTLYSNLGGDGFSDRTAVSGLGPPGFTHTGFGTVLFDAELDGDLDLAVANGRVSRGTSPAELAERRRAWRVADDVAPVLHDYAEPNHFFVNGGGGRFEDASARAGALTRLVEVSRGLLPGDLDGDGDLDLVLTGCGGRARLLRNDAPRRGHWLRVRAVDPRLGRDALGAVVEVRAGDRTFVRPVIATVSYLSAVEPETHFGLGEAKRFESLVVVWPDGVREEFPGGEADRAIEVLKGRGTER